jgi:predicted GNAT family N-acyltransferase
VTFRVELRIWDEARKHAEPVRYAVFMADKDAPPGVELDDIDPQCIHALAYDESGRPVGTARMLPDGGIGRLVVLRDWRRRGVGGALVDALIEEARKRGLAEVSVSAPLQAAEFYRELGFVADGKVVKEGERLYQRMRRALS